MAMAEEKTDKYCADGGSENKDGSKSSKKKNKKSRKRQRQQPQPGDPGYKTPTQLRNARKRRKKKQEKAEAAAGAGTGSDATKAKIPESGRNNASESKTGSSSYGSINDPSLKYLSNPKAAPTVRNAIKFFREKTNAQVGTNHDTYFPVTLGAKLGWRTVARLAVRVRGTTTNSNDKKKVRIGLFVPGSHELLPVPDCPVHNRRINGLVKVLEDVCNALEVPALDDESEGGEEGSANNFGLRYIAISVERSTQKQQLVLVWKEPPPQQQQEVGDEAKQQTTNILEKLVRKLMKFSGDKINKDIRLHSIWVHYNNTWKHSNSIFDREGRWETRFVDGEKSTAIGDSVGEDPLRGAIREAILPLRTPKAVKKSGKTKSKSNDTSGSSNTGNEIDVPLYFPPQVFRQANLDGFAKIILRIREWLHEQQSMDHVASSSSLSISESQNHAVDENTTSQPPKRKRRRGKRDASNASRNKDEEEEEKKQQHHNEINPPVKLSPSKNRNLKQLGHCLELYGGVGTIGLNLIDRFDSLDSSDENPFNEACFNASADKIKIIREDDQKVPLDSSKRSKITYTSKSASEIVVDQFDSLKRASVVVVDPPRKGLDPPVIEALCSDYYPNDRQQKQQHLVYVSCGFDAFRRDYRALVEHSGKWTLDRAEGHILFPGSDAIETLAFFTRTK